VAGLTKSDLRGVIELLYDLGSAPSPDPFPLPMLDRLGTLVGAHTVGYCEFPLLEADGYWLKNRSEPPWFSGELHRWGDQDPITCKLYARSTTPLAVSDVVSRRAFQRLELYQYVCRPLGGAEYVRLFLPARETATRFFFFDRERWGLNARERELLQLLRPHFVLWRRRWSAMVGPTGLGLTERECEILEAVADGATNREIAERLWISPHTVRTHLQHIYEKLDVRTRTEAAALLRHTATL